MLIWVNGTFGVGKTTTAGHLVSRSDRFRVFDPECVGQLLGQNLADHQFSDFQDLRPWRALVPVVADEIAGFTKQELVAVQTVLRQEYWDELMSGLVSRSHDVLHVLLDATPEALHARIDADPDGQGIRTWRHDHVEKFVKQRPWLLASSDVVVDTDVTDAAGAAAAVLAAI